MKYITIHFIRDHFHYSRTNHATKTVVMTFWNKKCECEFFNKIQILLGHFLI
jgi:hypothetical protein